jgi:phosphatidate cytidylyltransferase
MKLEGLNQRLTTAAVLLGLVLALIVACVFSCSARWILAALSAVAVGLCAGEFARMCRAQQPFWLQTGVYFAAAALPAAMVFMLIGRIASCDWGVAAEAAVPRVLAGVVLGAVLVFVYLAWVGRSSLDSAGRAAQDLLIGLVLVGLGGGALTALACFVDSQRVIIWLVAAVCCNDSGAYFAGKRFEGPRLAEALSPKKTVSGAVGGWLAGSAAGLALAPILPGGFEWGLALPMIALIGAAVQAGDLGKSFVKRLHGVKDSGSLLPGHGGVLDRLDGILMAAPLLLSWLIAAGAR